MKADNTTGYEIPGRDTGPKGLAPRSPSFLLLDECLASMRARGKSAQSVRDLTSGAGHSIRYFERLGLGILTITREDAIAYQGSLIERGLSARTIASYMVELSSFCAFLEDSGYRYDNPARAIARPQTERSIPWGLPDEVQMESFLAVLSRFYLEPTLHARKFAFRAHVMAELQYASGLRLEELSELIPADLDLPRGTALVRRGKGGKSRRVFLTSYAIELLSLWLDSRDLVLDGRHDMRRLFGSSATTLVHNYNRYLTAKAREAGLSHWSSHGFRHALGYHLLRAGCDVRRIKEILGHERIATTEIYTEVNREDLLSVLDTFHPRAS